MATFEQLRRKVETAGDLRGIVKTMKALAAVGIRQYEEAADALAHYDRTVLLGLRALLRDVSSSDPLEEEAGTGRFLIVAFGSDEGMCGPLNDGVAARVKRMVARRLRDAEVVAVGARLASILGPASPSPKVPFAMPGSIEGVGAVARRVLAAIQEARDRHGDAVVFLVFPRRDGGIGHRVRARRILPLDRRWITELRAEPWPTRCLPAWPGDRRTVLRVFVREYLFVSLYRALVDTLASEHASRLSSMQAAERNIEERLDVLQDQYRRERQEAITSELMDIVSGFEALGDDPVA